MRFDISLQFDVHGIEQSLFCHVVSNRSFWDAISELFEVYNCICDIRYFAIDSLFNCLPLLIERVSGRGWEEIGFEFALESCNCVFSCAAFILGEFIEGLVSAVGSIVL